MSDEVPTLVLEEVVSKEPTALSDQEKTFLTEHKDELTTTEAQRFSIQVETKVEPEVKPTIQPPVVKKEKEDDDDEVLPEDEEAINKVVSKRLTPVENQVKQQQDVNDINNLIASKPEYAPYREQILAYAKHDAYKQIPIHNIASIVAAKDQQKIGARKEREAQRQAAATKGGGTTSRSTGSQTTDWRTVSKDDYIKKRTEVMGAPR
ncbi:MAG: hypothetical protein NUV73_04430 [Candidatus Daviesbacteria bacterium]|nr:hypothetical protein [Candidatus Daviesbacteria bacterium]